MSSRTVIYDKDFIKKVVPTFDFLNGKHFPTIGEINKDWDSCRIRIDDMLSNAPELCKSAVIQQYNEYIIYNELKENKVLAPIIFTSSDERGIPILGFPKFRPIVENDEFYKYTDEENFVLLGMFAEKYGLNFSNVRDFIDLVQEVCIYIGIREDDILYNLSNVGYNPDYGLRVIDYGLVSGTENFVLVI